jgi:hypothetical protein
LRAIRPRALGTESAAEFVARAIRQREESRFSE